ncbi:hypothetical protein CW713_10740 [Methanophagales archaeon]|nr:MAG: hypothetical protein CW713_10740 [Methanophagales archaeon]
MNQKELLVQLEQLAEKLGIEIRYERIKNPANITKGGLCKLKGRYIIIIDSNASASERVDLISSILKRFNLKDIYILPALRRLLEKDEVLSPK